jgi:cell division protein FtsQ
MKRIPRRGKQENVRWRMIMRVASWCKTFFLLGLMVCIAWFISQHTFFPIKKVVIQGEYGARTEKELQQLLLPYVSRGFFAVSLAQIKQQLGQVSWIRTSCVTRNWPGEIIITLKREQPFAHWNNNALLTQENKLFYEDEKHEHIELPHLYGEATARDLIFSTYLQIQALFDSVGLKIATLSLDKQEHWQIDLRNGIHLVMDKAQSMDSIKKFVQDYGQTFSQKAAMIEVVDLRYQNGFAVRWKKARKA